MTPINFGIASKALSGMLLVIAAALLSFGTIFFTFLDLKKNYEEITDQGLRGLISASNLVRETEKLLGNAPDIIISNNPYILRRLAHDIDIRVQEKDQLFIPLREAGINEVHGSRFIG